MLLPIVSISTPNILITIVNKEDLRHEIGVNRPGSLYNASKEMEDDIMEVLRKHDIPSIDTDNFAARIHWY